MCGCILGLRSVAYYFWVTVTLTSDLISRIILSRAYEVGISNLGLQSVGHLFGVTVTLTDLISRIILSGLYPILFEAGFPNLVCGCIFRWWSVTYHFWVTVTMTFDLFFNNLVQSLSPILFKI